MKMRLKITKKTKSRKTEEIFFEWGELVKEIA